jgi:hypothetical protein
MANSIVVVLTINLFIEFVFIMDIFILLLKPIPYKAEIIMNIKEISKKRVKSFYFYFDLFAAFPSVFFELIWFYKYEDGSELNSIYDPLYLLKLFKLRYAFKVLDRIFDWLKINSYGNARRLLKLVIGMGVTVHTLS